MKGAVSKRANASEIIHAFTAIADNHEGMMQLCLIEGKFQNEPIAFLVLCGEYWSDFRIHAFVNLPLFPPSAMGNSTQKRLPWPDSDSTPTLPPMRSTTLRTMARPMPVPSYPVSSF